MPKLKFFLFSFSAKGLSLLLFFAPKTGDQLAEHDQDEHGGDDLDADEQVVWPAQGLLKPTVQV